MLASVETVRWRVRDLRAALLAPSRDPIEKSLAGLVEAAGLLAAVEREIRSNVPAGSEIRRELLALKRDLGSTSRLIEHGARFYRGLAGLLSSATLGYTPSGEAAPLAASGSISIEG
jgi:hypothetical protein